MPNFVDCEVFRPPATIGERRAMRESLGIPPEAFVVGCVAAVKKHHKRVDYLIREFARFCNDTVAPGRKEFEQKHAKFAKKEELFAAFGEKGNTLLRSSWPSVQNPFSEVYLLIAGAKTDETAELLALAESLIPGRYKIMTDCGREQMPDLYRCMDVFVLTSLFEMMPIALLEALASGLPCVVNGHPVMMWMVGNEGARPQTADHGLQTIIRRGEGVNHEGREERQEMGGRDTCPAFGGMVVDMGREGVLAEALAGLTSEWLEAHARGARERAVAMFSKEAVVGQYVEYYRKVMFARSPQGTAPPTLGD